MGVGKTVSAVLGVLWGILLGVLVAGFAVTASAQSLAELPEKFVTPVDKNGEECFRVNLDTLDEDESAEIAVPGLRSFRVVSVGNAVATISADAAGNLSIFDQQGNFIARIDATDRRLRLKANRPPL